MLKAIKIRLYPNNSQKENIDKLLGCYRKVYNECLNYKIQKYTQEGKNIGFSDLGKYFHSELRNNDGLWYLKEQNTKVLKQSIINLLDSYKRFFVNNTGFPKFKSKHDNKNSARFTYESISIKKSDFLNGKISLIKGLYNIKFRSSDRYKNYLYKNQYNIRSATLSRTKSGNYYLSILANGGLDKEAKEPVNKSIGIDIGIKDFMVDSKGNKFPNIKIKRNHEKKLNKLHKRLSKKKLGSKNRDKARKKLAKYYEHITNKKENYLHYITNKIIDENQIIILENLSVKNMLKNRCLSKSIQELSINRTVEMLKYKSEWHNRTFMQIDKWFPSSKLCSNCGHKNNNLALSDRTWTCPKCNTKHDRDENAATNIENEGSRLINKSNVPLREGELTPLENCSAGHESFYSHVSTNSGN